MKNIEFVVLSCDAYITTRVRAIRESWAIGENVKYLVDSQSDLEDVIGYNTQKNYSGIYEKYLNFFKTYNFNNYDYYFFTDDDTFVNKTNLNKLNLPPKDELFCMGRILCLNPDGTDCWGNQTGADLSQIKGNKVTLPLHYLSGGSGFILSKSSCIEVQKYLLNCNDPPKSKYGDVSIGFWMRNSKVRLIKNENFWWSTHEKLLGNSWETYTSDENVITFHYVNEETMLRYDKKYNI